MMKKDIDHVRLVRQAQAGDKKSLEQLAQLAREPLRDNVYRMTMDRHLAEDIVQETVLEMLKILGKLEHTERFRPWLWKIALNKLRLHRQAEKRRNTVPISSMPDIEDQKIEQRAMSGMAAKELRQIIYKAMWQLKPEHRAVLTMRCYREMDFPTIAEAMGRSEFAVRKLFWRAKGSLQKQLSRHGFRKGSLVMALIVFGKMTASSDAAAAKVSIAPAATKVGVTAALAGLAGTKTAVISLVAAGAVGVGAAVTVTSNGTEGGASQVQPQLEASFAATADTQVKQYLYFYPDGAGGPAMLKAEAHGTVRRLPTDERQAYEDGPNLMMIVEGSGDVRRIYGAEYPHALKDEYFQYSWPTTTKVIDNRDTMHKRGWTYFKISGEINGQMASGAGRVPFVYDAAGENWAWMKIRVGDRETVDTSFAGFSRPWMGLHAIDTVRRDAGRQQIRFETRLEPGTEKAEVALYAGKAKLIYTIDMERDVVEQIRIASADGKEGRLRFTYLQEIDSLDADFAEPVLTSYRRVPREGPGLFRLFETAFSRK
ncbi:MAG: RNA polymerase sigma factor [Planctomycetota bacterium]|jgi:RNA polymerase sigma-70 factor (ECF subfamily)